MTNLQENSIQKIKKDFETIRKTLKDSIVECELTERDDYIIMCIHNDLPNRYTYARTTLHFIIGKRGKIEYFDFKDNNRIKDYKRNIREVVCAQHIN